MERVRSELHSSLLKGPFPDQGVQVLQVWASEG